MQHPHGMNIGEGERWSSVIAGTVLAAVGLTRRSRLGLALASVGSLLVFRGTTGYCGLYQALGIRTRNGHGKTTVPYQDGVRVEDAVTINRPRDQVYRFWRTLENLPRFMRHLESVRPLGGTRSHWIATGPAGREIAWDAEITNETENELLAWHSLPGAAVDNVGSVLFKDAPRGQGTEVIVKLQYRVLGGKVGALAAKLWGEEPSQQIREDLHRLKQVLEAGEIVTTDGQPTGSGRGTRERRTPMRHAISGDRVETASEQSFPASDAPAWRA